jgi:hypothetical protein
LFDKSEWGAKVDFPCKEEHAHQYGFLLRLILDVPLNDIAESKGFKQKIFISPQPP